MTIANLRFVTPNAFDSATLADAPAMVATLPAVNLQDTTRRPARTVGLPAPQYLRGNFAGASQVSAFVLWRHNLTTAGSLRLKIWDGLDQTGTLLYDSGAIDLGVVKGWGEFVWGIDPWGAPAFSDWAVAYYVLFFDAVNGLSFELQVSDPANADGYIEFARVVLGYYFEPLHNFEYGHTLRWEEDTTQERTEGGSLRSDPREPYRIWRLNISEMADGERAQLMEILRLTGKRNDLFVSCFPGAGGNKERDYSGMVKIQSMPDVIGDLPLNYKCEIVLAET